MKRRPRDIGTKAESAVVRYIQPNGFPHAERRSLRGALDAGDITGTPAVCWEVKGGDAARTASDLMIERWMAELTRERENARAEVGILVVQRAGVGPANAGRWWAVLPLSTVALLRVGIKPPPNRAVVADASVRMLLADAVTLLRAAGYGEPETVPAGHDGTRPDTHQPQTGAA
ncbi:hypothetical protein M2302_000289 [Micromonospora sp. A200]|uniref:hypothetical protein n=1 Tax=Micromonospora sp. A200 TaxID=2940568 RepID=UPI002475984A|nr:hypothetical protein [Micromonospora sp. A200]MDH6460138.1 hypothetical protein [Micromonospora sp. A200]